MIFLLPTLLLVLVMVGLYALATSAPTHIEKQPDVEPLALDANRADFGMT